MGIIYRGERSPYPRLPWFLSPRTNDYLPSFVAHETSAMRVTCKWKKVKWLKQDGNAFAWTLNYQLETAAKRQLKASWVQAGFWHERHAV